MATNMVASDWRCVYQWCFHGGNFKQTHSLIHTHTHDRARERKKNQIKMDLEITSDQNPHSRIILFTYSLCVLCVFIIIERNVLCYGMLDCFFFRSKTIAPILSDRGVIVCAFACKHELLRRSKTVTSFFFLSFRLHRFHSRTQIFTLDRFTFARVISLRPVSVLRCTISSSLFRICLKVLIIIFSKLLVPLSCVLSLVHPDANVCLCECVSQQNWCGSSFFPQFDFSFERNACTDQESSPVLQKRCVFFSAVVSKINTIFSSCSMWTVKRFHPIILTQITLISFDWQIFVLFSFAQNRPLWS